MWSGSDRKHLLGLVVLLVTMGSGYVVARVTGAHEGATGASDSVSAGDESAPSSTQIDFYVSTDFHIRVESDIRELATRYGLSENLVAALLEADQQLNPVPVSFRAPRGLMQPVPPPAPTLGVDIP